jgi:hypothetical protein
MAFGFPAYHRDSFATTASEAVVREAIFDAIELLGWSLKDESDDVIRAGVGFNFWSHGETVGVRFLLDGGLLITSRCWMPTQCFDWGKNEQNVRNLISELRKAVGLARLAEETLEAEPGAVPSTGHADSQRIQDRKDRIQ